MITTTCDSCMQRIEPRPVIRIAIKNEYDNKNVELCPDCASKMPDLKSETRVDNLLRSIAGPYSVL